MNSSAFVSACIALSLLTCGRPAQMQPKLALSIAPGQSLSRDGGSVELLLEFFGEGTPGLCEVRSSTGSLVDGAMYQWPWPRVLRVSLSCSPNAPKCGSGVEVAVSSGGMSSILTVPVVD